MTNPVHVYKMILMRRYLEKYLNAVPMCSAAVQKTSAGAFLLIHKILTLPLWARPFNTLNHQSLYNTAITYILTLSLLINTKGRYNKLINTKAQPYLSCGYTPRSSLPSFIRRTLIFNLMFVSCRSGQKQSSAGAIITSRGIPQVTLMHTLMHRWKCSGDPPLFSGMKRASATQQMSKKAFQRQTFFHGGLIKISPRAVCR